MQWGTGVNKCWGECGCPDGTFQEDCSDTACAVGCDKAFEADIRDLFFHGEDVLVDPHIDLSLDTLITAISDIRAHVDVSITLSDAQLQTQRSEERRVGKEC